jgi:hypothetical protein
MVYSYALALIYTYKKLFYRNGTKRYFSRNETKRNVIFFETETENQNEINIFQKRNGTERKKITFFNPWFKVQWFWFYSHCGISILMSNILFFHGYATKYVIMNGIKKLKKLIYTNNCIGNC